MKLLDSLTDFIWTNCIYLQTENTWEEVNREVMNDLKYNHLVYTSDEQGLTGVCRFKINEEETVILDVAVRKDKRGNGILPKLLMCGLRLYPKVKRLRFNSINKKRGFTIPVSLFLTKGRKDGHN